YFTSFAHLSQYLSTIVAPSILKSAVWVATFPHAIQKNCLSLLFSSFSIGLNSGLLLSLFLESYKGRIT
ncbi:MAG TPA: hypothetical protein VF884_04580, partial [Nitrososphaeraceae archaeon]